MTKAVTSALSGQPSFDLSPAVTDAYFQNAIYNPTMRNFQQDTLPQIKEAFAGVGAFSSAQGSAVGRALGDLNSSLAGSRTTLAYQDQQLAAQLAESARQRQVQGVQLANALAQQPLQNTLSYMNALAPFQQRMDAQAQSAYQEFLRTSEENSPWLGQAQNFIGQSMQAAYWPQQTGGLGAGIAGGIGGATLGAGALAGIPFAPLLGPIGFLGGLLGGF